MFKRFAIAMALCLSGYSASFCQTNKVLNDFPSTSPEAQGFNSVILDSLLHFIKDSRENIHHLTVIRNGHTVLDTDIYPYSSRYRHDLASVTKSITSLLIGIAIDRGLIRSENETVLKYFPEVKVKNPLLDSLKISDLVTMRSGFDCSLEGGEQALRNMRKTDDWVRFVFNLPIVAKPGNRFAYCSCNFYLLGEIIYRATKLKPQQFAQKFLFDPLQISGSTWLENDKGINHGWGDLFLYPEDLAKIGQMALNKGKWKARQVISEKWMSKSIATLSHLGEGKGYGYGWWINNKVGFYEAAGRGHQTISVLPAKNVVVTMLGGEFNADAIGAYILRAMEADNPLPDNPDGYAKFKKSFQGLVVPPDDQPSNASKALMASFNRRTIQFERNIAEIDSVRFNFISEKKGDVLFYRNGIREKYPFAISTTRYAIGFDPKTKGLVALKLNFIAENEMVLHFNQLCRINNFYFHFVMKGNEVETIMEEKTNYLKIDLASSFSK